MYKPKVSANSFIELYKWVDFALSLPQLNPNDVFKKEQALEIVEIEAKKSIAKGVRCLTVGIGEIINVTQDFVLQDLGSVDKLFLSKRLTTYSDMMFDYSKSIQKIIKSNKIKSKKEFELIQACRDSRVSNENKTIIESIIYDYEQSALGKI